MWIKFSDKKPKDGVFLITRSYGYLKKGDAFEDWRVWTNDNLKNVRPAPTHWWNGEPDFEIAIKGWNENVN